MTPGSDELSAGERRGLSPPTDTELVAHHQRDEPAGSPETLRPRDWAVLLLASGELLPRQRARDQQADLAGMELKRSILEHVVGRDPEPGDFETTLFAIVQEMRPTGPARALAQLLRDEWTMANASEMSVPQLLDEALTRSQPREKREKR